ncbi:MAG: phosphotransferase, partial [Actinomycetota bacterium]
MDPLRSRLATARARHALRCSGLPYQGRLERASSTHNEIHLNERYVIRTSKGMDDRLSREAMVYPHLPRHQWTPVEVATGTEVGADFLIIERKPGRPLAHVWPELTPAQRRYAVHQLGAYLSLLHRTATPPDLPRLRRCPQLLDGQCLPATAPLDAAIDELRDLGRTDLGLLAEVEATVDEHLCHLDGFDETNLVHGDLTFENLLWHDDGLSAVIDFEWCRGGPADLDLDVLLRCCAFPALHVGADHVERTRTADYADVLTWLAEVDQA